ncbi:MAG: hypothetical protein ACTSRG_00195 [Candidatus Helarchaeota archaeon]
MKELGLEASKANTDLGEVILFEAPVKDRTQKCIAKISHHDQFGDIVEVVSVIGELDKTDPNKALENLLALLMLNQHLITAKTQVDQKGDKMYIVARTLAPSCSNKELGSMIQEVTIYADVLEQQLFGVDKT